MSFLPTVNVCAIIRSEEHVTKTFREYVQNIWLNLDKLMTGTAKFKLLFHTLSGNAPSLKQGTITVMVRNPQQMRLLRNHAGTEGRPHAGLETADAVCLYCASGPYPAAQCREEKQTKHLELHSHGF